MKKLVLLFGMLLVGLTMMSCMTPYSALVESVSKSSHFMGAEKVDDDSTTARWCPGWTDLGVFAKCYFYSESYRNPVGSIDDPLEVPIHRWTVGQLQLHGAVVYKSWGLDWFDSDGNSVDPKDFVEGEFYTYHKIPNMSSGFQLINP